MENYEPGGKKDLQQILAVLGAMAVGFVVLSIVIGVVLGLLVSFPPLGILVIVAIIIWWMVRD